MTSAILVFEWADQSSGKSILVFGEVCVRMLAQLLVVVTRGHEALSFQISKCIPAYRYGIFPACLNDI